MKSTYQPIKKLIQKKSIRFKNRQLMINISPTQVERKLRQAEEVLTLNTILRQIMKLQWKISRNSEIIITQLQIVITV